MKNQSIACFLMLFSLVLFFSSCKNEKEDLGPLTIKIYDFPSSVIYESERNYFDVRVTTKGHDGQVTVYFKAQDYAGNIIREFSFPSTALEANKVNLGLKEYFPYFTMVGDIKVIASTNPTYSGAVTDTAKITMLPDGFLIKNVSTVLRDVSKLGAIGDEVDIWFIDEADPKDKVIMTNQAVNTFTDSFLYKTDGTLVAVDTSLTDADGLNAEFVIPAKGDYLLYVAYSDKRSSKTAPNYYRVIWK